ncbi:restriction endonuclease S subunit [Acetobacter estunensis NRIC 0472]|nr:restriction endonuclease S subunit [Acetobacter estunensis NRIC 0472]
MPLYLLFRLGRGRVISHEEIHENGGEYPVYSSQTEDDGVMGYINSFDFEGDYITWTTDGANAGTLFVRSGRFNCTNVCGTLFASKILNLYFVKEAISLSVKYFVRQDINPKLMNNVMSKIRISLPTYAEQNRISEMIAVIDEKYSNISKKMRKQITLLKERRAALISAAVTGKIDVRAQSKALAA